MASSTPKRRRPMAGMRLADRSARDAILGAAHFTPLAARDRLSATTPTPAMSARTPRPLDGLTILVIDDHCETVELLREYLYSAGATVVGADSAKAALAFAETHVLDAVLVDIRMPGEDGHWFVRNLRTSRAVRRDAADMERALDVMREALTEK